MRLAVFLRSDGMYLSAHNLGFKSLNLKKLNFEIIGSAHNIKEIVEKKDKGVKRYCFQSYFWLIIKKINYLEINKFNNYFSKYPELIPLGGIKVSNLNKLKLIKSDGFAILSEIKKSRLILLTGFFNFLTY